MDLSDDDMKKIMASLAWHIQNNLGEGIIEDEEAGKFLEDHLKNTENGFGMTQREAHSYRTKILEVGENEIGLLVRCSPQEIGFFHRVFQEYLAAYLLSSIPLTNQLNIVKNKCTDPQWKEVILGLFHFTRRGEEVEKFLRCIKDKKVNFVESCSIDMLIFEAVLGDFNCPVPLARELAQEAFEKVELGSWMSHRAAILEIIIGGLRSKPVRDLVKSRLKAWFPNRFRSMTFLYEAMAKWPPTSELLDCLIRGLYGGEIDNKRGAAQALAEVAKGDKKIGQIVCELAQKAIGPQRRAAAIECLILGWPDHELLPEIIEKNRYSLSPELRLMAIKGKVYKDRCCEEDMKELIRLGSWDSGLEYYWGNEVGFLLVKGWKGSIELKKICMESVKAKFAKNDILDAERACKVLIEAFLQDDEVANFLAEDINNEEVCFTAIYFDFWELLKNNFENHPKVVNAIENWIEREGCQKPNLAFAALVGRTKKAKIKLLSSLTTQFRQWPAGALLEGWGMNDPEVSEALNNIAYGPSQEVSWIGHLLPKIISDKNECRRKIIEHLKDATSERLDFLLQGLINLGNTQGDKEVVDIVLQLNIKRDYAFQRDVILKRCKIITYR